MVAVHAIVFRSEMHCSKVSLTPIIFVQSTCVANCW